MNYAPPKRSKILLIIGCILLLFGSIFGSVGWFALQAEREYETSSVLTQGTISNKIIEEKWENDTSSKQRKKRTNYYVYYNFMPEGSTQVIESRDSVDSEFYAKANNGDKLDIQYIASDASKNRIAGDNDYIFGYAFTAFGLLAGFTALALIYYDLKKRSLIKRLAREGVTAEATVLSVAPSNLSVNNVQQWKIRYTFKDMRGQDVISESDYMSPEDAQQWQPSDKSRIKYDKDNSSLNIWLGR